MNTYGVNETNPISQEIKDISEQINYKEWTSWEDPELKKIVRLRLLSDPGFPFWDVSYCYGQMKDGTYVQVGLPFFQLPKKNLAKYIIKHAMEDGVHAANLGLFTAISTLN